MKRKLHNVVHNFGVNVITKRKKRNSEKEKHCVK